ncbi:CRE-ETS-4 protein [Aphelenchoides avenae]|nr:CRE-ETS-4 protein [Aphelenchus avenae]
MNSALYPSHDLQPLPHLWNAPSLAEGDLSEFDDDSDIMGQRIKLEDEFDLDSSLHGERPLSRTLCTPDLPHESDAQIKPEVLSSNVQALSGPSIVNQGTDGVQMDIYRELILRHLVQDINATCNKLNLPTNPSQWNSEQTNCWVREMCQQFQLPTPQNLSLNGKALLSMSQEQFCCTMSTGGDTLHAQLQLWKTAFESYNAACQPSQSKPTHTETGELTPLSSSARTDSFSSSGWSSPSSSHEANDSDGSVRCVGPSFCAQPSQQLFFGSQPSHSQQKQQQSPFFAAPYFASSSNNLPSPSDSDASSHSNAMLHDLDEDNIAATQFLGRNAPYSMASFGGLTGMHGGFNPYAAMDASAQHPLQCLPGSSTTASPFGRNSGTIHLWHFIREVLDNPKQYGSCVRWVNREEGTFKIESSHHLARYWGLRKNRCQMNYDKLSRSLRQYYKKGIIQKPEKKQRLVYKFLPPYNL